MRQGIAGAKLAHQSMCQGHDDRRLHGEMARPQLARQLAGLPQQGRRGVEAAVEHLPQGGGGRRTTSPTKPITPATATPEAAIQS